MNDHEPQPEIREQRSSISIKLNAKGDAQVDVKIYVGEDEDDLRRTRELAVDNYKETLAAIR